MSDTNLNNVTSLDVQIESVLNVLKQYDEGDPEFTKHLEQLDKLVKIRKTLSPEEHIAPKEESKDKTKLKDWIPVIGSLGGILTIVTFEAFGHVLTSKAAGFVGKMK